MTKVDQKELLEDLFTFLRIPSVSTLSEHAQDVWKAAEWLVAYLKKMGMETGLVETGRHPLVWGKWQKLTDRPTLLFYGHYDVQPPDPLEEWESEPFEPVIRGDKLVARGAADNKGQLFINLLAIKQLMNKTGGLPVNVAVAVEGEEEIGSAHFGPAYKQIADQLAATAALVTDAGMPKAGQPALIYGLRGIIPFEVIVSGPSQDLHSGSFGGMVENPALVLVKLLAALKDEEGRVAVPGFYDQVREAAKEDRENLAKIPRSEAEEKEEAGVDQLMGEPGYSPRESTKLRPSLDINGLTSGFAGEGFKTIIPAQARAKFSIRLVPDQNPEEIAEKTVQFLNSLIPKTVRVEIKTHRGSAAVRVNPRSKFAQIVSQGLGAAFGYQPVFNLMGGSIPAAAVIAETNIPVIITGFSLPDSRLHAPNENLDLPHFFKGIEAIKEILDRAQSLKI